MSYPLWRLCENCELSLDHLMLKLRSRDRQRTVLFWINYLSECHSYHINRYHQFHKKYTNVTSLWITISLPFHPYIMHDLFFNVYTGHTTFQLQWTRIYNFQFMILNTCDLETSARSTNLVWIGRSHVSLQSWKIWKTSLKQWPRKRKC